MDGELPNNALTREVKSGQNQMHGSATNQDLAIQNRYFTSSTSRTLKVLLQNTELGGTPYPPIDPLVLTSSLPSRSASNLGSDTPLWGRKAEE